MPLQLPDLPYAYDALEPHIDEATMRVHHDKHHQAYVDKVNAALEGTEFDGKPIEEVLKHLEQTLKRVVFGQDRAIESLSASIKLARAGLREPEKPIGCYLFSGPTGVGKTEVAKQLAATLGVG